MFTAALFIIAKTRKQPKCPTTDTRIKNVRYKEWNIFNHKKEEKTAICNNMNTPWEPRAK